MEHDDESLITPELEAQTGRATPPREITITPEIVQRVLETVEDDDPRWRGAIAPPYVLLAFERNVPVAVPASVPASLVTGDEWTLQRLLRVGERLSYTGRLDSAYERFGSRFGHTLVLRLVWTFVDADDIPVAEVARGMIHYRPPSAAGDGGWGSGVGTNQPPAGLDPHGSFAPEQPGSSSTGGPSRRPSTPAPQPRLAEGEPLPPLVLRPTLAQVVRYCGLTWNFTPIFFDPEEARRAGLPGTIVPGPLKLALLTRYLAWLGGPDAIVRSVRAAHRRPDLTGTPITLRGTVSRIAEEDGARVVECEVWIENAAGERSAIGSAAWLG